MKEIRKKFLVLALTFSQISGTSFFNFENHVQAAKIFGLRNIGNSCYYNATIQQLYSIDTFRSHLIDLYNSEFKGKEISAIPKEKSFLYSFSKLFYEINNLEDRGVINSEALKKSIGFLVDGRGDCIDSAFSAIFSHLDRSGICFSKDFKILSAFNVHFAFSPDLKGLSSDDVDAVNERTKKIRPSENVIDVVELLNYMFTNDFKTQNNENEPAKNILICLDFFKKKMSLNLPEKHVAEGETFLLKSLSVNTGGHFVSWVKVDNDKWQFVSDSNVGSKVNSFQEMLERAKLMGNISSVVYSKQ